MIKGGPLEEITAGSEQPAWRTGEDGTHSVLRATDAGLSAVGAKPAGHEFSGQVGAQEACTASQTGSPRLAVRAAAQAVVAAWKTQDHPALPRAIDALHGALEARTARTPSSTPHPVTKRATVLALLHRTDCATITRVVDATGWARHTVHGFFAGLKKTGTPIKLLERVRQVGAGKQGAAGSYTVYRIGEFA